MSHDTKMRLSKVMSDRGLSSRREADRLIEQGLVRVDGQIINQLGTKVNPQSQIEILPGGQRQLDKQMTIAMNKPIGYVSSQPEKGYRSAMDLIRKDTQMAGGGPRLESHHFQGLGPAGRLDIDSQGLIIYTQNGVLAKAIIGEDSDCEKEYLVRVRGSLPDKGLALLRHGLSLDGQALRPAQVDWLNQDQLRFILKEGKKRQIRRMCEAVGLEIAGLKRVRIGSLMLGHLPEGQWRFLGQDEVKALIG